jgi:hypothetical protein
MSKGISKRFEEARSRQLQEEKDRIERLKRDRQSLSSAVRPSSSGENLSPPVSYPPSNSSSYSKLDQLATQPTSITTNTSNNVTVSIPLATTTDIVTIDIATSSLTETSAFSPFSPSLTTQSETILETAGTTRITTNEQTVITEETITISQYSFPQQNTKSVEYLEEEDTYVEQRVEAEYDITEQTITSTTTTTTDDPVETTVAVIVLEEVLSVPPPINQLPPPTATDTSNISY